MKSIRDFDIDNKKVLIRCDFNVPIKDGVITDDTRIVGALDTINYAIDKGAKVILFSHLGRIKEEADLEKNDLKIVSTRLSELLNKKVTFVPSTRGKELEEKINNMNSGDVLLFQNTRYEDLDGKKESSNDSELGKYWASLGDYFINDAFGTIHRAHASNVGIASNMEGRCGFGFLVEKELNALSILDNPERPFVVILGGAKVEDKIGVIKNLVTKADKILIGGGMAYTFLKASGKEIGESLLDEENIDFCKDILNSYNDKIVLPIDTVVADVTDEGVSNIKTVDFDSIGSTDKGVDVGEKTVELFEDILKDAKTVIWNGPLGMYEHEELIKGTNEVLSYLVNNNIKTVLGGGDVVAAAELCGLKDKVFHASTGGGATLEYLEGKELPGIVSIK